MRRKVTWVRKHKRATFDNMLSWVDSGATKQVTDLTLDMLGMEKVCDYPAYDNGMFYVVDTVADVEWTVMRFHDDVATTYRVIPLDKYEAIRVADELKEAEERANA